MLHFFSFVIVFYNYMQDISIIAGLRIDGQPVVMNETRRTILQCQALILELLGIHAPEDAFKVDFTPNLKISWLKRHFTRLPYGATDLVVTQHARA